jgi:hypothetical protein
MDYALTDSQALPSVNQHREYIRQHNDGSQPAEPGQRCSQIVFETWLKKIIMSKKKITSKFGWKYTGHSEQPDGVVANFVDLQRQMGHFRGRDYHSQ